MDQELADAAAHAPGRRSVCSHLLAALFCVKWRHAAILKVWRSDSEKNQYENQTPSVNAY